MLDKSLRSLHNFLYRGFLVFGRHRIKSLREFENETQYHQFPREFGRNNGILRIKINI